MPELPELEIAALQLRAFCEGDVVTKASVLRDRSARAQGVKIFEENMRGRTLESVRRHGKNLFVDLSPVKNVEGLLWIHFGMSGKFAFADKPKAEPSKSTRVVFDLKSERRVFFEDARLFGGVAAGDKEEVEKLAKVAALGPDALDLRGGKAWKRALTSKKGDPEIKVALMDQARVAGLGNIQAAEALYFAERSPEARLSSLTDEDYKRLAKGVRETIKRTLDATIPKEGEQVAYTSDGAHVENPFRVYGREGETCGRRKCSGTITRYVQAQRATFYCPECQS